jgi:hypothetical protein
MEAHAAQPRHRRDATRAAMDATPTPLAWRVSPMPAMRREPHRLGPERGMQATLARATTLLRVARLGCRGTRGLWTGMAGAL